VTIDVNFVTSISTVAAVVVSIWALIFEERRSRRTSQINVMLDLEQRFFSKEMLVKRSVAAKFLLQIHKNQPTQLKWEQVDGVFDYFETIGSVARTGHADTKLVWSFFYYWISYYFTACNSYISSSRKTNPGLWGDANWLYNRLKTYDLKNSAGAHTNPSSDMIQEFLVSEIDLILQIELPNRVAGDFAPPAPTPRSMRVRNARSKKPTGL
jgi:hypothetical protein